MSLADLIRGKRKPGEFATATPATLATTGGAQAGTVATVATVAVAERKTAMVAPRSAFLSMCAEHERAIHAWLAAIGETDPEVVAAVIAQCHRDADSRAYFIGCAAAHSRKHELMPDDRRACYQCRKLIGQRCAAALRGETGAPRDYEPVRDVLRRCDGYSPGMADPDRRDGQERWPGLMQKRSET